MWIANVRQKAIGAYRKLTIWAEVFVRLGFRGGLLYGFRERVSKILAGSVDMNAKSTYQLSTPLSRFPLECRTGTSDREVFAQVFIRKQYGHAESLKNIRYVVDCGANIGYTSAYFLTLFPDAICIAVEPEENNFAILKRNLRPFGARAIAVHAGAWSHVTLLKVLKKQYRDGKEWSTQVRDCDTNKEKADVEGIDIGTLLDTVGFEAVDLLKMDIEGAEAQVFTDKNACAWLSKVKTIMIELHSTEAKEAFTTALVTSSDWSIVIDGELSIASRVLR